MKLKTLFLFLAFACSGVLFAEDYKVELFDVKTVQTEDSVIVISTLQVNMQEMPSRNQLRFTPVVVIDGKSTDFGPMVLLNGKKQHYKYKCQEIADKSKPTSVYKGKDMAFEYNGGKLRIVYRGAVALDKSKSKSFLLFFRREMIDSYGDVISTEMMPLKNASANNVKSNKTPAPQKADTPKPSDKENDQAKQVPSVLQKKVTSTPVTAEKKPTVKPTPTPAKKVTRTYSNRSTNTLNSNKRVVNKTLNPSVNDTVRLEQDFNVLYKGSYLQPAEDAIYLRNQKELRFSLEEAKVIAEINPNMLSLRELFAVAQGYTDRSVMFHKIIKISVDLYPSNPIANLNAAASAIELGNMDAAANYLQVAPHDTLAYKNCRGAYELMRNNVQEGLRLLKAASAEGSAEADENLKIFFGSFRK